MLGCWFCILGCFLLCYSLFVLFDLLVVVCWCSDCLMAGLSMLEIFKFGCSFECYMCVVCFVFVLLEILRICVGFLFGCLFWVLWLFTGLIGLC